MVIQSDPLDEGRLKATLRLPHQPEVVVRSRGPRESLYHIRPEELRTVLANAAQHTSSTGECYRAVLTQYGLRRLTDKAWAFLHRCEQIPE